MLELPTSWKYWELREDARRHTHLGTRRKVGVQRRFPRAGKGNMEWSLTKGHFRVSQGVVRGAALFSCLFWFVCFVSFLMCISNKQLGFLSFFLSFFFFFMAVPHSMWDIRSPTRDWTSTLCTGSTVSNTGLPGNSWGCLLERKRRIDADSEMRKKMAHLWNFYAVMSLLQ